MVKQSLLNIEVSSHDNRDIVVETLNEVSRFPRTLDLRPSMPKVWHQGTDGPCSAYAAVAIKQWQEKKDYGLEENLSRYFIYNIRSNYPQKGMTPRDTMKILHKYGVPVAKSYHIRKMRHKQDIPEEVWQEAANHRILAYGRVLTIDGLKESLYKNGPAYIAMPVFNNSSSFWKPGFGQTQLGGHALVVVGYNKHGFILRNSWGRSWADSGHTIYPYKDFGAHFEIWTAIDDPNSTKRYTQSKPKRSLNVMKLFKNIFNR